MLSHIIGTGIISAIGRDLAENAASLFADGNPAPKPPTRFKTALKNPVFEIPDLKAQEDRAGGISVQLLEIALDEALASAGLSRAALKGRRVGVAIGTTIACQLNNIPFYETLRTGKLPAAKPFVDYVDGMPAEYIRRALGLEGPAVTVSNACSSGADAIGIAHLWLSQGLCDIAIAGGTDEINKVPYDGFNALGVCSTEPCRPFDAARIGLNLGEAAGVVILSKEVSAHSQCAVAGFGKASDAFHITQPAPDGRGLRRAIAQAMGSLSSCDIAFINAHGTGTLANDAAEAAVFADLFGADVHFMSTKGRTGHTLGAAGAIEAIFTAVMLEMRMAARSWGFENRPDDFAVSPLIENISLDSPQYALSTSLAFGGSNTVLLLERCKP